MIAQIQFLKMERSEAIEEFVTSELQFLGDHLPKNREAHFHVWLEYISSPFNTAKHAFRCAIEVDGLKKKQFFVEKRDENFYRAFHSCMHALDAIFCREKKSTHSRKRRN